MRSLLDPVDSGMYRGEMQSEGMVVEMVKAGWAAFESCGPRRWDGRLLRTAIELERDRVLFDLRRQWVADIQSVL